MSKLKAMKRNFERLVILGLGIVLGGQFILWQEKLVFTKNPPHTTVYENNEICFIWPEFHSCVRGTK